MKKIIIQIREYAKELDLLRFLFICHFTGILIFCNYYFEINQKFSRLQFLPAYISWSCLFFISFLTPYLLQKKLSDLSYLSEKKFQLLLFLAPLLFALKMTVAVRFPFADEPELNLFLNQITYWPFRLIIIGSGIVLIHIFLESKPALYGAGKSQLNLRPYFAMLLIMVPLVAAASTQPDFLEVYPKLKRMTYSAGEWTPYLQLVYELAYGTDFITIELFFRGFLILAFVKFAGKDTILPMAVFYAAIHFGKPVGECISSFFGGILLGVVTYHTRSIYGGLIVHLGIAWMMELGGYLGGSG